MRGEKRCIFGTGSANAVCRRAMLKEWKQDGRLYRYGDIEVELEGIRLCDQCGIPVEQVEKTIVELFGKAGKYDFIDVGFGVGIGCREFVVVK